MSGIYRKRNRTKKDALEHLHNADLSNYGKENIEILEGLMDKLNMEYLHWTD